MSTLHLSNIPDHLYQRIEELAKEDRVTVGEEAVQLLHQAVNQKQPVPRTDVAAILAKIRHNVIVPPPGTPDSVEMLREDRER